MKSTEWILLAALLSTACGVETEASPGPDDAGSDPVSDAGSPTPIPLPRPDPAPPPDAGMDPAPDPDPGPFTCAGRSGEAGRRVLAFEHDGLLRSTYLHVPESYDSDAGTMLVLSFHGFTSAGWQQALLTGMGDRAEARGFIVAYPQGVGASWNAGDCCGTAWTDSVDDVGFTAALIDRLAEEYCIDPRRVYATGMSNGGFFSHRLACELSDRIAAIAPVAGVLGVDPEACVPPRAVPVFHFHGTADPLVPYRGGTPILNDLGLGLSFRSVADTMSHWARLNRCTSGATTFFEEGDVTCVEYGGCGATTRLCSVEGGGHTWPGGLPIPFLGHTTEDIDASAQMLDFFALHPMPLHPVPLPPMP